MVKQFLQKELPQISIVSLDATYLLWLDCHQITEDSVELAQFIREKTGLYLSDGVEYGGDGNYFLRLNVACPKKTVEEGLKRFKEGVTLYIQEG